MDIEYATDEQLADELGKRCKAAKGGCVVICLKEAKDPKYDVMTHWFYGGKFVCLGLLNGATHQMAQRVIEETEES